MIVDDSSSMRQMVAFTLKEAGFSVQEGTNGLEALQRLEGEQVDLVITDINMPVMDGISLVRALRERESYRFTPILILTTERSEEMKQKGKEAGATGWIVKPFNPEQLQQVLRRVLRSPSVGAQ